MIAISKGRKEEREQPRHRVQEVSNRMSHVRFEAAENNRFRQIPSQQTPRQPLEIISERRQIRKSLPPIPRAYRHEVGHDDNYRLRLDGRKIAFHGCAESKRNFLSDTLK